MLFFFLKRYLSEGIFEFSKFKLMFHYRTCFNVPADLIWRAALCHFMKIIYRTFCLRKRILLDIVKNIQRNSTQNDNGKNIIKVKIFYKLIC